MQEISIPEIYYILAIELFYACKLKIPEILKWKKKVLMKYFYVVVDIELKATYH